MIDYLTSSSAVRELPYSKIHVSDCCESSSDGRSETWGHLKYLVASLAMAAEERKLGSCDAVLRSVVIQAFRADPGVPHLFKRRILIKIYISHIHTYIC